MVIQNGKKVKLEYTPFRIVDILKRKVDELQQETEAQSKIIKTYKENILNIERELKGLECLNNESHK